MNPDIQRSLERMTEVALEAPDVIWKEPPS